MYCLFTNKVQSPSAQERLGHNFYFRMYIARLYNNVLFSVEQLVSYLKILSGNVRTHIVYVRFLVNCVFKSGKALIVG